MAEEDDADPRGARAEEVENKEDGVGANDAASPASGDDHLQEKESASDRHEENSADESGEARSPTIINATQEDDDVPAAGDDSSVKGANSSAQGADSYAATQDAAAESGPDTSPGNGDDVPILTNGADVEPPFALPEGSGGAVTDGGANSESITAPEGNNGVDVANADESDSSNLGSQEGKPRRGQCKHSKSSRSIRAEKAPPAQQASSTPTAPTEEPEPSRPSTPTGQPEPSRPSTPAEDAGPSRPSTPEAPRPSTPEAPKMPPPTPAPSLAQLLPSPTKKDAPPTSTRAEPTEVPHLHELFDIYQNGLDLVFKRYSAAVLVKGTFEKMSAEAECLDFVKFYRMCRDFGIAHTKGLSQVELKHLFLQVSKKGKDYKKIAFEQFRQVLVLCADALLSRPPFADRYQTLYSKTRALFHRMDLADARRAFLTKRMLAFGGFHCGDGKLGGRNEAGIPTKNSKEFSSFNYRKSIANVDSDGATLALMDSLGRPGEPETPPPVKGSRRSRVLPTTVFSRSPTTIRNQFPQSHGRPTLRSRVPSPGSVRGTMRMDSRPFRQLQQFDEVDAQQVEPFARDHEVLACSNHYHLNMREKEALALALGIEFDAADFGRLEPAPGPEHRASPDNLWRQQHQQHEHDQQRGDPLWDNIDTVDVPHGGRILAPQESSPLRPVLPLEPPPQQTPAPKAVSQRRGAVMTMRKPNPPREPAPRPGPDQRARKLIPRQSRPQRGPRPPQTLRRRRQPEPKKWQPTTGRRGDPRHAQDPVHRRAQPDPRVVR